uniref:FBA_2 domain-containing protein n=2 Tax=Caenorhabditis tropicalis TaxID=1561998 RepID=A0A1I7U247_9PELO
MGFEQNRFVEGERKRFRKEDISAFIRASQHFLDVLNCRIDRISFDLRPPLTDDQLIMMIDWLNGMKIDIQAVSIRTATWPLFELFITRFQKSVSRLHFFERNCKQFKCDGIIYKRLNFEIKRFFSSNPCPWFNLEFLFNMDTEKISAHKIDLSPEDLNVFLRSWQEGKTNQKLRKIQFETCVERDVKEVLNGCGGELMDPRTAKFMFRDGYQDMWIHGGILIRRNDGRLAVIDINYYEYSTEEQNVTEQEIQKYLKVREIWNSEESSNKWNEKQFFMYIFSEI